MRLKYVFLCCLIILLPPSGIFTIAWYYGKDSLYVFNTLVRALVLKSIALAVKLHDPCPEALYYSIGPNQIKFKNTSGTPEMLSSLVRSLFPHHSINIVSFDNKPFICTNYIFGYQPAADPALKSLREKYDLSKLLHSTENDFEQLVAIANWVHSQWLHGTSGAKDFNPMEFNADIILTRARLGDKFWCHVYSMTFIQVAASLGYQARLVSLTKDGYESSDMHAVAEVWSNFYGKWITVDTDFNIWYTQNGIPLSVLEIHNAFLANETNTIRVEKGITRSPPDFEKRITSLYSYYRYFYVDMRNDWLTNRYFPGHPARSDQTTLFWSDKRLPPVLSLKTKVTNKDDLYWDINRTYINFGNQSIQEKKIEVYPCTVTPNFSHFEVSLDNDCQKNLTSSSFFWQLRLGVNTISIRSVNSDGVKGIESRFVVAIEK